MKVEIKPSQARRLALASQGLTKTAAFGGGKNGLLNCLEQLGYVQIDTISVINRAHNHTIWTRVPSYKERHLDELQREGRILEYWSHAAAYLPMADYRFCRLRMNAIASGEKHWYVPDNKMMKDVLDRIKAEGPLMAKDFEPPKGKRPGAWWQWKPAKRALEQLFIEGKLVVRRRINFHKVYDLPERVLPPDLDTTPATTAEFSRHLIDRSIRSHGLIAEPEISYLRKGIKPSIKRQLSQMLSDGEILTVHIKGSDVKYYSKEEQINVLANLKISKQVHLLSPFDNAVIQRKRVQQIFDFDYQVECYVPKPKRIYGYFCLPILYGSEFVGRLDPKADRTTRTFLVRNIFFEKPPKNLDAFLHKLTDKLIKLAKFNDCERIHIEKSDLPQLRHSLNELIAART